jgi:hypothetical protein
MGSPGASFVTPLQNLVLREEVLYFLVIGFQHLEYRIGCGRHTPPLEKNDYEVNAHSATPGRLM